MLGNPKIFWQLKRMRIELKKFGDSLISRPDGREAFLILSADNLRDLPPTEAIEIDFEGVKALAPSWADEVITPLAERFSSITLLHTENASVQASLKTLREYSGLRV